MGAVRVSHALFFPLLVVMLSAYEEKRQRTMVENAAHLASLGIQPLIERGSSRPRMPAAKRKERGEAPQRRSARAQQLPVSKYTPGQDEVIAENSRTEQIAEGARLPDGRWRGECFGEVAGVPEGTCFGVGDYQRLGRQEMAANGFFRPFVTPEWNHPTDGCFSIILNNDNPASGSKDDGAAIRYAGSGGRQRGQNRTAPQSFDQDWSNVSNAALRTNCESGRRVRVIRGPKLAGKHGTASNGGGYRYDGLYRVMRAELERGENGLLTAMFTLVKCT